MTQRTPAWCLGLGLIGLGLAAYLYTAHLGLLRGELLGGPVCGGTTFNCHVVTASRWGSFLGLPLALWGLTGYVAVIALALLAWQSPDWATKALTLLAGLATAFVALDVSLLVIMLVLIGSLCPLCLATYAVNVGLLIVAIRGLGQPWPAVLGRMGGALSALVPSARRPAAALFWGMVLIGLGGGISLQAATTYVNRGTLAGGRQQLEQFVSRQPRVQVDVSGDPRLGPPGAAVEIVEFSDLRCPACQQASKLNHIVLANHRQEAALVFKHFPLDTSCNDAIGRNLHPGACQLAAATECAHQQGKFWALHDRIFERGPAYKPVLLNQDIRRLGLDEARFNACMNSGEGLAAVRRDIAEAVRLEVTSTPTFVVNGVRISGIVPPAQFGAMIELLRSSGGSRAQRR